MMYAPLCVFERVALVSACFHIIEEGKEVPDILRNELTESEWAMVLEYKAEFFQDVDTRR